MACKLTYILAKAFRNPAFSQNLRLTYGRFFWALLQIRVILDQIQASEIRAAIQSIPSDLDAKVKNVLDMIGLQNAARSKLAIRTLAFLAAAQAPLTAQELCHAMGIASLCDIERDPVELSRDNVPASASVVECCLGLVSLDPVTKVISLAHYDIEQHLQRQWTSLFAGYLGKGDLTNWCIAYISLNAFSNGPCLEVHELSERLEQYTFLAYASRYWGQHAREALLSQDNHDECFHLVRALLSERRRRNLESSLQVSALDHEAYTAVCGKNMASFQNMSSLQVAVRFGLTKISQVIMSEHPGMIVGKDTQGMSSLYY